MSDNPPSSESVTLTAADGQQLSARLFAPAAAASFNGLTLQINGATGVPRGYYDAFAGFMAGRGFAVLNFDYRGISGSRETTPGAPPPRMLDWARHDIPAAAEFLSQRFPEARPCMLGHSFGGQALGLLPQAEDIAAAITIGAQQGYWRNWPAKHQVRLAAIWYVAIPLTVALRGHVPGRMLGGEPLPRGVDALARTYAGARVERQHIAPGDWGLARIGHFGFFKRDMPQERWGEMAEWLYAAAYRRHDSRAA